MSSSFADYMEDHTPFSSTPGSPHPAERRPSHDPVHGHVAVLQSVYDSLKRVKAFAVDDDDERKIVTELMAFVRDVQGSHPQQTAMQRFELLQPLRSLLLWLPVASFEQGSWEPIEMVVVAHLYAIALTVAPLFPTLTAASFGNKTVRRQLSSLRDVGPRAGAHGGAVRLPPWIRPLAPVEPVMSVGRRPLLDRRTSIHIRAWPGVEVGPLDLAGQAGSL